ncbi:MAG TPA: M48 family metallopeptidase [Longimicrobiaceae bacterium]|nr:M48 family metallopeptidase [Longimicrobiaceae bacterium]
MHTLFNGIRGPVLALALGGAVATAGGCAPALTTQQEVEIGRQNAAQVNQQLPIVRDAAVNQYINELGRSIARGADPRGIPYTFQVVNSNVVNAFALPGGYIYINRGVIERASNASELAGVMSHEIAHVVERHGIEQVQRAQNANMGLALLYGVLLGRNPGGLEQIGIQAGGTAVFASYGRDAEREADLRGVEFMTRAGYNPQGMVSFFEKLLSERQRNPSRLEQWFATHPLTEERIQITSRAVAAIPAATRRNLNTDTRAFQSFKSRVRSLPATRQ